MNKAELGKSGLLKNIVSWVMLNVHIMLMAIVIILLLIFNYQNMSLLGEISQKLVRAEGDNKFIKVLIEKRFASLDDEIKELSEALQKANNLNMEENKIVSAIPEDNAFFKKTIMSNHQEALKSISDLKKNIDQLQSQIGDLKARINELKNGDGRKGNHPGEKDSVETVSI